MADVAATLRLWSTTAGNNGPQGSTVVGTGVNDNFQEIQKVVRQFLAAQSSDIASAGTTNLSAATGFFVNITGTTTITSFGTEDAGIHYLLKFAGALTLTHNATSLILPGGVNILTAAGDQMWVKSEGSGNWRAIFHTNTPRLNLFGATFNASLAFSVGSGALTCALKTQDGGDPDAADAVIVGMPNATISNGTYNVRTVTAALSMVISSGSTLGHGSTIAGPIYHYLIDNAGTVEYAVSNKFHGYSGIVSTTAEGGVGGADSASVMYSTTARASVPFVCIARTQDTQTTAGTWAAMPAVVQFAPFPRKASTVQVFTGTGANTSTKPWDLLWARVKVQAGGGGGASVGAGGGSGGGGGGGGYAEKTLDASVIGPTETATVGAGGAAAAAGGTSSFGSHASATGGGAGTGAAVGGSSAGGLGGVGSGGDVNVEGGDGGVGISATAPFALGGHGGSSVLGGGGQAGATSTTSANGTAGNVRGGGGGGSVVQDGLGKTGGAGADGIIIVEEHYI